MPPYWDPLGEFEPHTTKYKLCVFEPRRPAPAWWTSVLARTPATTDSYSTQNPPPPDTNQSLGRLLPHDLPDLSTKTMVLQSWQFPYQMRCEHTQGNHGAGEGEKGCKEGCYVLEKGGEIATWKCTRSDCEGHVYSGNVKSDEEGRCCFGKKGRRMVCLQR